MNDGLITQNDLAQIYDLYFDKIYKFFYYKTLSKEVAEDLTSDTFITYAQILKENKDIKNLQAYLFGVAKNIFLKYLKLKYKKEIPISTFGENFEDFLSPFVEEVEKKVNYEDKLLMFLDQIPEKQQIVIRLRFIEKLSLKEICEKLNKNMNYVKTTQKRAIKSLKAAIETNLKIDT